VTCPPKTVPDIMLGFEKNIFKKRHIMAQNTLGIKILDRKPELKIYHRI
jgi:hypothetical protein